MYHNVYTVSNRNHWLRIPPLQIRIIFFISCVCVCAITLLPPFFSTLCARCYVYIPYFMWSWWIFYFSTILSISILFMRCYLLSVCIYQFGGEHGVDLCCSLHAPYEFIRRCQPKWLNNMLGARCWRWFATMFALDYILPARMRCSNARHSDVVWVSPSTQISLGFNANESNWQTHIHTFGMTIIAIKRPEGKVARAFVCACEHWTVLLLQCTGYAQSMLDSAV